MTATSPAVMRDVPFFNYRAAFSADLPAYLEIVADVVRRGAFIQQEDLARFEANLARYLGVRHAIGVGNATDGLIMLCRGVGLGPGDEVIFPSHTMVATAAAAAHVGATPVPADCGDDHLLDADSVSAAITPRTRAIIPVHLNGRVCNMDALQRIADEHRLIIVEDAAQALGARFRGRFAGTFGAGGAFSFYPAKILGCFGDGGAVITDDDGIARKLRLLRDHGRNEQGEVELWGLNSRLDNLQAAVLDHQFRDYGTIVRNRRELAARYDGALRGTPGLRLPPPPVENDDHFDVFQNYEIEAERRDELRLFLAARGIGTLLPWGGKAVHQFAGLPLPQRDLPRTEELFARALMLPLNLAIAPADVDYVCDAIREFCLT